MANVRRGELIAAVAAVALLVIMFLTWFGEPASSAQVPGTNVTFNLGNVPGVDTTLNAWQAFDFIDIVLLITIVVAIGLAVITATQTNVTMPVAGGAMLTGLGMLSTALVLYRIIDPPSGLDRKYGIYLGLIAVVVITIGGWIAMQEEGSTFAGEADRLAGGERS